MASHMRPSDEGESSIPTYKRRRVGLACRSCRGRKSRCDGALPACGLCIELGFECVYERPAAGGGAQQKARGEPNDRLAAIERVLEMLVQRDKTRSDQEHQPDQEEAHHSSRSRLPATAPRQRTQQPTPQSHHDARDDSCDIDSRENSGEEPIDGLATVSSIDHRGSRFFGPSSNIALLKLAAAATPTAWQGPNALLKHDSSLRKNAAAGTNSLITESSHHTFSHSADPYVLPPRHRGLELLRTFFSDTGMLFPYIYEARATQAFTSMMNTESRACRPSSLCLIQIIFAFGARTSVDASVIEQGDIFAKRAQALVPKLTPTVAGIETIQALLLVAQYLQGTQQANETWSVFGAALRSAFHLGLQSNLALKGLSPLDAEIRKRTWFGCVILDMSLSMTFGRPPAIPKEYIRLKLPLNTGLDKLQSEDAPNQHLLVGDSHETVSFFIATIKLYAIQRDILTIIYDSNLESDFALDSHELLHHTFLLDQRLHEWWLQLEPHLKMQPWVVLQQSSPIQTALPPVFDKLSAIIKLRYLNTQILLYRPTLIRVLRGKAGSAGSEFAMGGLLADQIKDRCIVSCEASAAEVIEIVHKCYTNPSLLGAGWFSAYYTFNASLVTYIYILLLIYSDSTQAQALVGTTLGASTVREIYAKLGKLHNAAEAIYGVSAGAAWGMRLRDTIKRLAQVISTFLETSNTSLTQASAIGNTTTNDAEVVRPELMASQSMAPLPLNSFALADSSNVFDLFSGDSSLGFEAYWADDFIFQDTEMSLADHIAI